MQAFVKLGSKGIGLRPGKGLTKLLLDRGSGLIFDGTTNYGSISQKLSGKGKSVIHNTSSRAQGQWYAIARSSSTLTEVLK